MSDLLNSTYFFSLCRDENVRADILLSSLLNIPRARVQKNIASENFSLNGKIVVKNSFNRFFKGSLIEFEVEPLPQTSVEPEDIPLEIVFENDDFLIINKPPNLLVHPGAGHFSSTLQNGIVYYLNLQSDSSGRRPRAGIVHRIDKDTSGLLVVAKTDEASEALSEKFLRRDITRQYLCLVWGKLGRRSGTIETFHGRDPFNRLRFSPNVENGRKAVTHYEVVDEFKYASKLKITLETGRTHQIRMHMNYIGHPIMNDGLYNGLRKSPDPNLNKLLSLSGRQLLHSSLLGFRLFDRDYLFQVPPPRDMEAATQYLKKISGGNYGE